MRRRSVLALLAGTVQNVTGVGFDSSRTAIAAAQGMAKRFRPNGDHGKLKFLYLDVTEAWPEGLFDVVSLVDVMHHVPPAFQMSVLETAAARVRPGGVLLYKDMANGPAIPAFLNRMHDLVLARQWIHYLPVGQVDAWAARRGFRLAHSEQMARFWYRHELRTYRKE